MRFSIHGVALVAILLVACGGNVQTGGTSNGGTSNGGTSNGGTSNGGTSNGGTSNGGTGGGPVVSCSGFVDCCTQSCDLATHLACPSGPPPGGCQCDAVVGSLGAECIANLTDAYRCLLKAGANALTCTPDGGVGVRCGFCTHQLSAVSATCSTAEVKCVF